MSNDSILRIEENCSSSYMTPWATVIALTALYILLIVWFCKRGKKMCLPISDAIFPYQKRLNEIKEELSHLLVDDIYIELTDEKLGQGHIGFVFKGFVFPKTQHRFKQKMAAAIKMSYPIAMRSMGLLEEASRLSNLHHPNIVRLIAVSHLSFSVFRPMIVMEWLSGGSLAEYFKYIRKCSERERPAVLLRDILDILSQISEGLKYIHESKDRYGQDGIHGDIAARNVLLTSTNLTNCLAKLGDFGVPVDYGPLPVAWLPPEIVCALSIEPKHRTECDVWMFGVLSWECLSVGAEPHYNRNIEDIRKSLRLSDRGLSCPVDCPLDVWSFVLECLSDAHRRPRFSGSRDSSSSILYKLSTLRQSYSSSHSRLHPMENISMCLCTEHRCKANLPNYQ